MTEKRKESAGPLRTAAALVCACAMSASAQSYLRDGDIWVLIGDSITNIGLYRQTVVDALDHYHPGHSVQVINAGIWGLKTNEAQTRGLDVKPSVVSVMLGMNNVIHADYGPGHDFSKSVAAYGAEIRRKVRAYRRLGADVILMTPTLTDEQENSYFSPWSTRRGLVEYGEEIRRICDEEGCAFLPAAADFESAKATLKPLQTLITDGVHPYGWGQYVIAASLIDRLRLAEPFAAADGRRGFKASARTKNDFTFAVEKRFAAARDEAPAIAVTPSVSGKATLRWSVGRRKDETAVERGEIPLELVAGKRQAVSIPAKNLPPSAGCIRRLFVSVTPASDGRPRAAVVDLARTKVLDMTKGFVEGEVRTDRPRAEGPLVAKWRVEEDGADLWITGHSTAGSYPARPKHEIWMNSSGMNGAQFMFDFRPADRFADNNFDRDVSMIMYSVCEKPWSVIPLVWEGRRLQNCTYCHAERTADGYDWRLGFRGFIVDYTRFDIRTFDHFGMNILFGDDNGKGAIDRFLALEYPEDGFVGMEHRLNLMMIFDRKGGVPQVGGETTNVGVFAL